jgi:WD40 repeat protein
MPEVMMWDLESGSLLHSAEAHTNTITGVALSSEDEMFITWSDHEVIVWRTETFEILHQWGIPRMQLARFTPESDGIVTVSDFGTVALRHLSDDETVVDSQPVGGMVLDLYLEGENSNAIAGCMSGFKKWRWGDSMSLRVMGVTPPTLFSLDFSTNGQVALVCDRGPHPRLLDVSTGAEICRLVGIHDHSAAVLSDSGQWAAMAGSQGEVLIYDLTPFASLASSSSPEIVSEAP